MIRLSFYMMLVLVGFLLLCVGIFELRYIFIPIGLLLFIVPAIIIIRDTNEPLPFSPTIHSIVMNTDGLVVNFHSVDGSGQSISYHAMATDCTGNRYTGSNPYTPIVITGVNQQPTITCPYVVTVTETNENGTSLPSDPMYFPVPS